MKINFDAIVLYEEWSLKITVDAVVSFIYLSQ